MAITDLLRPNLMFPDGHVTVTQIPYNGDGARIIEQPYIYLFNGSTLTDGTSPRDQTVQLDGDSDFLLRRVFGLTTIADTFRLYDSSGAIQYMDRLQFLPDNYVPSMQIGYPANGLIRFDLGNISRSLIPCGSNPIYQSIIGFQGVKLKQTAIQSYTTPYPFKRLPYTYNVALSVNWRHYTVAPTQEPPRPQYLSINNYDFELHEMRVCFSDGTQDTTGFWQITLYDYNGFTTSNLPIPVAYLNDGFNLNGVFPVPPLLYPVNSILRWDVRSMICPGDATFPKNYVVQFIGMQRYPKGTGGQIE